jgi:DNA-binding LytR/AlgR family response regulator
MINCIIVDDEQHAIDILEHYVSQTPSLHLVGSTTNPVEGLHLVSNEKVDLVFLDIQMPELTGIDFIKTLQGRAKVILTTAYSEFALEGYELDVVDYLLKPVRLQRFLQAVQKAGAALKENEHTASSDEEDYIFVKTESKGKLLKINLDEIDYIEGMKNYVAIHRGGQKTLVYTSMKDLEDQLPGRKFIRVQKSFIIPVTKITGIEGNMVRLKNVNAQIQIGDSYKQALMDLIKNKTLR